MIAQLESFTANTTLYLCTLTLFMLTLIGVTALACHIYEHLTHITNHTEPALSEAEGDNHEPHL